MKKSKLIALVAALVLVLGSFAGCSVTKNQKYAEVYETTGTKSKLLSRQADLEYEKADPQSANVTVTIDEKKKFQDFLGLGASMTHSSAHLLMQLEQAQRTEVLKELFSLDGAGYNFVRVPVGASDYIDAAEFFTCNDTADNAEDLSLSGFTLSNDLNLMSVLKEVSAINPDVKLIAVPWSAPAWMKTNKSLLGGRLEEKYNGVFADYLLKFVKSYKDKDINFSYISILNEPFIAGINYPHMQMDGNQSAAVIKELGPKLKAAGLSHIKIMAYEHNYSSSRGATSAELFIDGVLEDKEAKKYVSGVAYHGYGNSGFADFAPGLEYINDYYKGTETYITEITEHSGSVDFASNISYGLKNVLINPINYNLSAAMYWNFVLTSDGKPVKGNDSTCFGLMNIDKPAGGSYAYTKNAAYYAMAHISKFAYPVKGKAAKRVLTTSSNDTKIIAAAFMRADKKLVAVAHNTNDSTYEDVDFVVAGRSVTYRLMPQSVVTIVFNGTDENYAAFEIENVEIRQSSRENFDFYVKLDKTDYTDLKFYFTGYDKIKASDEPVSYTVDNGRYKLNINKGAGDYFLYAVAGGKTGVMPVTIPKMSPFVTKEGSGSASYLKLDFSVDGATSWSSFIDPKGKNVYKSASATFDGTAKAVKTNISITEGFTNDTDYSDETPYYYVVLNGKNGRLKFVSFAVTPPWVVYKSMRAELKKDGNDRSVLNVRVEFFDSSVSGGYALLIRSGAEQYRVQGTDLTGGVLEFNFVLSTLTKDGTWYDVLMEDSLTGQQANLNIANKTGGGIDEGIRSYDFKEWQGDLKINFDKI